MGPAWIDRLLFVNASTRDFGGADGASFEQRIGQKLFELNQYLKTQLGTQVGGGVITDGFEYQPFLG